MNGKAPPPENTHLWTPTPKHILRQACIAGATSAWKPARFIEMGAGVGSLTVDFLERGYSGICYDLGERSRALLKARLARFGDQAQVADSLKQIAPASFDYLFAFEVLEHIADDAGALRQWTQFLKPGGACIVSVPAHQAKFSAADSAVGHLRRYEKAQLMHLFGSCGYGDIQLRNYGFPLGNMTRVLAGLLSPAAAAEPAAELSIRSGVERPPLTRALSWLFNRGFLRPFIWLQGAFYQRDWGDGYVLTARKMA